MNLYAKFSNGRPIDQGPFDDVLQFYKNPGTSEDFPYNKKLEVHDVQMAADEGYIVIKDADTEQNWVLATLVFAHVEKIFLETE